MTKGKAKKIYIDYKTHVFPTCSVEELQKAVKKLKNTKWYKNYKTNLRKEGQKDDECR